MSIVVLKPPDIQAIAESRQAQSPSCKGEILQRRGGGTRPVRDPAGSDDANRALSVLSLPTHLSAVPRRDRSSPADATTAQASGRMLEARVELSGDCGSF